MKHIFMILFILFSIVGFADVAPAMNIRFNDIKMVIPKQFELVRPVNKKEVIAENNFLLKKILKDWEAVKQVSIDDEKLSQENLYTMGVIARQLKRTKYSAWEIFPLLDKQLNAYLATSNEQYLSMFLKFYNYFISVRMDNKGRKNYAGVILPQWERLDRYNIFTVSPYKKYDVAIKDKLMRERGWSSLFFSDVNYSGLILSPILRFVQIVRGNDLKKYYTDVDSMLADAEKVIASHENEWVRVNSGSGYYIFPKNSPWYLDGVEIPVNEAAIFGNALVRAYLASGKKKYLVRAQQMWWRWKNYISKDPFGYICYPYFTGAPFKGWDKHDHISVNTPVFNPESRKAYEVFHKAALTIDFLVLLEQACPGSTVEYLKEFYYLMIAAIKTNSLTSCFPRLMGFAYPLNTYHSAMPFGFRGWTHLASQSPLFRSMAPILLINEKKSLDNLLYFQIVT